MVHLADTGYFVALLNRRDAHHAWELALAGTLEPPLLTCESALCEAAYLLDAPDKVAAAVVAGDVVIQSNLDWGRIQQLLETYQQRMDWTDACMVQLSELHRDCRVLTVDKEDFAIYRRLRNQTIPTLSPP